MIDDFWRAVEDLTERGFNLFPCQPNGKAPLIKGGGGCKGATADKEVLAVWSERYDGCNLGVATGKGSGIIVVDIDVKAEAFGQESVAKLANNGKVFPPTLETLTPSGGRHLYYRWVPGIRNSAGALAPGIDIRSDGGYVVAPPSTIDGNPYIWSKELPIARLPFWLEFTLKPTPAPKKLPYTAIDDSDISQLSKTVASAREGERNNLLFWASCRMFEDGRASAQNRQAMVQAALSAGLPLTEIKQTMKSAEERTG